MTDILEKMLVNFNMESEISSLIIKDNQIIYYLGDTSQIQDFMYKKLAEESITILNNAHDLRYANNISIIDGKITVNASFFMLNSKKINAQGIIFIKSGNPFSKRDISLIKEFVHLIEKYL